MPCRHRGVWMAGRGRGPPHRSTLHCPRRANTRWSSQGDGGFLLANTCLGELTGWRWTTTGARHALHRRQPTHTWIRHAAEGAERCPAFVVGTVERHAAALSSNPARHRSCWLLSQSEPNRSRVKIFSRTSTISAVMRLAMMTSHSCLKAPRSLMTFEPKNSVSCIAGS